MRVVVVPSGDVSRARTLLGAAGWDVEPGPHPDPDLAAALGLGSHGEAVLFVPLEARVARKLRRIVVLHEGSPAATAGLDAAGQVASPSISEVVVLHAPVLLPATEPGSLPAPRVADCSHHEWERWRREFLRRFCSWSPTVPVRLEVSTGPTVASLLAAIRRIRPDLIVATWKGVDRAGRAERLKQLARQVRCCTLMLLEPEARGHRARLVRPAGG